MNREDRIMWIDLQLKIRLNNSSCRVSMARLEAVIIKVKTCSRFLKHTGVRSLKMMMRMQMIMKILSLKNRRTKTMMIWETMMLISKNSCSKEQHRRMEGQVQSSIDKERVQCRDMRLQRLIWGISRRLRRCIMFWRLYQERHCQGRQWELLTLTWCIRTEGEK